MLTRGLRYATFGVSHRSAKTRVKRVFSIMITNTYTNTTTHPLCYIRGKRDGKERSFWFDTVDERLVRSHIWNMSSDFYVKCVCHGYLLHRLIMQAKKGEIVDHINHLPQDNMRQNLRIVTHTENMWNRQPNKDNPLPVRGVAWNGSSWSTTVTKNGHKFKKAGFETLPEAICYKIRQDYELHGDKSPNYRPILKEMPRKWLLTYFPEIYSHRNQEFIGTPIFNAHYKNSQHKSWHRHLLGVRKAGVSM